MKKLLNFQWVVALCLLGSLSATWAQQAPAAETNLEAKTLAVQKLFAERFGNPPISGVRLTPYGLYEVQLGMDLVYTDEKVNFVLDGTLIDAKTRRDITRERQDSLAQMPFDQLPFELSFKQVRKAIDGINNVTIFTFPYPILSPDSTQKVRNVWCASDRAAVWDAWMIQNKVPATLDCDVPIDQMVALGQKLMVRGTPALFFADGSRVGGAIPKDDIEKRLQQAK